MKYQINELAEFMDAYTSNHLTHGTPETLKKLYCINITKQQERQYKTQKKVSYTIRCLKVHRSRQKFPRNVLF